MKHYPDYEPMHSTVIGVIPEYHYFENEYDEFKFVYDQINRLLDKGVPLHEISVMAYNNDITDKFKIFTNNKIEAKTIHGNKGLENNYVFILSVQGDSFPSKSGIMTACHMRINGI